MGLKSFLASQEAAWPALSRQEKIGMGLFAGAGISGAAGFHSSVTGNVPVAAIAETASINKSLWR